MSFPLRFRFGPAVSAALLAAAAAVLVATAEPGIYTVDENAYLATLAAVRAGGLGVPHTGELPPSRELLFFDPQRNVVFVPRTPVVTRVPPFHALLALPFAPFGWRGLVALEALAFVGTIALVFSHVARVARSKASPYLAAAAVSLGAYALEYAQGVWPQALSAMLVTAAFSLAVRASDDDGGGRRALGLALASGLVAGLAAEVRYQNALIVVSLAVLLGVLARVRRRDKLLLYVAGAALPLLAAGAINHARLGTWNPVTKGERYLASVGETTRGSFSPATLGRVFWGKVVDVTVHPPMSPSGVQAHRYQRRDDATGIVVMRGGSLKKAWLQSCPWLGVALLAMALAWTRRIALDERVRRDLRAAGLVTLPVLLLFTAAGPNRTEGFGSNQRYFFELVPLAAIALALAWDRLEARGTTRIAAVVAACGWLSAFATVRMLGEFPTETPFLYLRAPLVVAVLLLVAWGLHVRLANAGEARVAPRALGLLSSWALGLAIGWASGVHWTDDVATANRVRRDNRVHLEEVSERLPKGAPFTLVTRSRLGREPFGPLLLTHDVVVVDVSADGAVDAARLIDASLARGRRVFVLPNDLNENDDPLVLGGRRTRGEGPLESRDQPLLLEVLPETVQ
jgi:hypothetical protein